MGKNGNNDDVVSEPTFVVKVTQNYRHKKSGLIKTRTLAMCKNITELKGIPVTIENFCEKFKKQLSPEQKKERLRAKIEKMQAKLELLEEGKDEEEETEEKD